MESCHTFCVPSFLWANQPLPSNPYSYPCHQETQGNPARQVRLVSRCSKEGPAWIQEMDRNGSCQGHTWHKTGGCLQTPPDHYYEERPAIFVALGVRNNESLSIPTAAGWPHARLPSGQRSPLQCDTQIRCHYTSKGCSLHQELPLTPC